MGFDRRAIAGVYWREPASALNPIIVSNGYLDVMDATISLGGITDSFGDDLLDSEGNIIYDSQGIEDPENPFGINSIISYGYWNVTVGTQLQVRVASFGYMGTFRMPTIWLAVADAKSWMATNSYFRMR